MLPRYTITGAGINYDSESLVINSLLNKGQNLMRTQQYGPTQKLLLKASHNPFAYFQMRAIFC